MLARYAETFGALPQIMKMAAEFGIDLTEEIFRRMGLPVKPADVAPIEISPDSIIATLQRIGGVKLRNGRYHRPLRVRNIF